MTQAIEENKGNRVPKRLRGLRQSGILQIFERALPDSINFGLGQPDLPTPECIRREAIRVIEEEQNGYTPHAGLQALREKIISEYPHLDLTADDCFVTLGSNEALFCAVMALAEEGDEVLVPDPSFTLYPAINQVAGAETVFYRLPKEKGFAFDAAEFESRLTDRTRAVIVLSPSNPTGRSLSRDDLQAMAAILKGTGIYAVSDEVYRDLYFTRDRPGSISEYYENTLVAGGLSKIMSMTGWRLGWLLGRSEVLATALVLHGYNTVCASTISQKAALAFWTPDGERAKTDAREIYRKRRDLLMGLIETELQMNAVAPDGAFYAMLDVSELGDEMEIVEWLLRNRVITINGSAFGSEAKGFLRISFCTTEENIREGINRMKQVLRG